MLVEVSSAEESGHFQNDGIDGHGSGRGKEIPEVSEESALVLVGGHKPLECGVRHVYSGVKNGRYQVVGEEHVGDLCFAGK